MLEKLPWGSKQQNNDPVTYSDQLINQILCSSYFMLVDYSFMFGTLAICIMMYFLKYLPQNNNVVWKENLSVCKQIFEHFNSFKNGGKAYESFFRNLLGIFYVSDIPLLIKVVEVGSSSRKAEKKQKRERELAGDTLPGPNSTKVKGKGKEKTVVDIVDKYCEEYTPRDERNPSELDVIIAEEKDEEGVLLKAKILQIVQEEDGIKRQLTYG